jgi:hypothetical protein
MIGFWGRLFGKEETLRHFEAEDESQAPDEYFAKFVKPIDGGVAFIEVTKEHWLTGPWFLWRSECVNVAPLVLLTKQCTEDEAKAELGEEFERLLGQAERGQS